MADLFLKHLLSNEKIPGIDGGREGNAEQCQDDENGEDDDYEEEYINDNKPSNKEYGSHRDCIAQMQETSTEEIAVIANYLDKLSEHNLIESQEMKQLE